MSHGVVTGSLVWCVEGGVLEKGGREANEEAAAVVRARGVGAAERGEEEALVSNTEEENQKAHQR